MSYKFTKATTGLKNFASFSNQIQIKCDASDQHSAERINVSHVQTDVNYVMGVFVSNIHDINSIGIYGGGIFTSFKLAMIFFKNSYEGH